MDWFFYKKGTPTVFGNYSEPRFTGLFVDSTYDLEPSDECVFKLLSSGILVEIDMPNIIEAPAERHVV